MDRTISGAKGPRSRAERQRETREALLSAALTVFARDGYHGATLESIATEAGFSKGAVYSNFEGKAELFLAVMDHGLEPIQGGDGGWDPFAAPDADGNPTSMDALDAARVAADRDDVVETDLLLGFALATLEFIATAVRDDDLAPELIKRVQLLLDAYTQVAAAGRPDDEPLPVEDVGTLLAALDQGVALLAITGIVSTDGTLLRTGLRRLLDPARAAHRADP